MIGFTQFLPINGYFYANVSLTKYKYKNKTLWVQNLKA